MRTVEELEHAGVAGLSIEDTAGPIAYGQSEGTHRLVPIEEAVGKMRAALVARCDPSLVIIGRTPALKREGIGNRGAVRRVAPGFVSGQTLQMYLAVKDLNIRVE